MSLRFLPRLATRAARPLRPTAVLLRHPSPLAFRPLSLSFPVLDAPKEPLRLGAGSSAGSSSTSAGAVQSSEGGMKAKWVPAEGQAGEVPKVDVVPRLQMTFTCTAAVPLPSTNGEPTPTGPANQLDPSVPTAPCSHRSTHSFTRQAYTEGTVLIQCPECKNRHLIADHLGWFKELTEEGKGVDVERILRAKGEEVKRGRVGEGGEGTVEFY